MENMEIVFWLQAVLFMSFCFSAIQARLRGEESIAGYLLIFLSAIATFFAYLNMKNV